LLRLRLAAFAARRLRFLREGSSSSSGGGGGGGTFYFEFSIFSTHKTWSKTSGYLRFYAVKRL